MSELIDAVFHGITIALLVLHFVDAKHQSEINKMQRRSIDKLQRTVKELEEVKQWRK
ncbi:hypothetical protein QI034_07600 [Staphylococcus saprophyticus]|nr:hypothetical protein [Staphylococcus saprophyticus]MDW4523724.1 hypothetical protein [Staphylococcus saprophyticus]